MTPRPASRAWVRQAFEAYTTGVAATLQQALAARDTKIQALEARVLELEADRAVTRELA